VGVNAATSQSILTHLGQRELRRVAIVGL